MEDNEFSSSTGDARENDPSLPGFTKGGDRLFRSQSQHAFRFGFDAAGDSRFAGKAFEEIEKDLEGGWLNVRVDGEVWTARAYDEDDVIREGARVHIVEIRGATALVAE